MSSVDQVTGGEQATRMTRRQRFTLILLLTANFTLAVDFSVLNVALPTIGLQVGFGLENLQWIATGFALAAAGFTLLFGRVADLFGRRRLFLAGMVLLGVSSLVGGLATTPTMLLIARVAQGLATAAVTPAALALLTTSFPEGPLRAKALGLNGSLAAAGFTTGAILGGVLTDLLSWRWAFYINVPVAVLVLVLAPSVLARDTSEVRRKLDAPGAVLVTGGLLAIIYGLTEAGAKGWGDTAAVISLVVGVVLLGIFWAVERKVAEPLVPVAILRLNNIGWGNAAGLLAFVTQTGLIFLLTLYLQKVLGYTPLQAGLTFCVLGVGAFVGGVTAAKILGKLGIKKLIVVGFLVQGVATGVLVLLGSAPSWVVLLLAATAVGGWANLLPIVGFMVSATSGLPDHQQGLATGLTTMTQQVGITLGIPILSAVVAAKVTGLGAETPDTVLSGLRTAIGVDAVLCVAAAVLIAAFLHTPRQTAAD